MPYVQNVGYKKCFNIILDFFPSLFRWVRQDLITSSLAELIVEAFGHVRTTIGWVTLPGGGVFSSTSKC